MKPPQPIAAAAPAWLTIAIGEENQAEIVGKRDNPRIVEYLRTTETSAPLLQLLHDETPWCAAFVNWCFMRVGIVGTNRKNARSWLSWGKPLAAPQLGCVAIFSAEARGAFAGHVGFYVQHTPQQIHVFGGNQRNRVCLQPRAASTLLGYRWPSDLPHVK